MSADARAAAVGDVNHNDGDDEAHGAAFDGPKRREVVKPGAIYVPSRGAALEYVRHTLRVVRRSKVNYCLGVCAVFVVVAVVALLISIIASAPVVFLRLAELQQGEVDMSLETSDYTDSTVLNYTLVGSLLDSARATPGAAFVRSSSDAVRSSPFSYHSPRWRFSAELINVEQCNFEERLAAGALRAMPDVRNTTAWAYDGCEGLGSARDRGNCFPALCDADWVDTRLFAIDSVREQRASCGRNWAVSAPALGVIHLQSSLAKTLGVASGARLFMRLEVDDELSGVWRAAFNTKNEVRSANFSRLATRTRLPAPASSSSFNTSTEYTNSMGVVYMPFVVGEIFLGKLSRCGLLLLLLLLFDCLLLFLTCNFRRWWQMVQRH